MLKLRNSSEICFPSPACFRQISISNIHFKLENTNIKNSCLKYLNVQLKPSYCPSTSSWTHHSVLDAEAELVLGVRPLDLDLHHRRTRDRRQLHCGLRLAVLKQTEIVSVLYRRGLCYVEPCQSNVCCCLWYTASLSAVLRT